MPKFNVNLGVTFWIDAVDHEAAEHEAIKLANDEYGNVFTGDCWIDSELMGAE